MYLTRFYLLLFTLAVFISCNAPAQKTGYQLVEAYPKLSFNDPVEMTAPDDGTNRSFIVSQKGVIYLIQGTGNDAKAPIFLDIKDRVESGGEKGLLGLAFHPDYKSNGLFYVNYTRGSPLETVVARYSVSKQDPAKADPASEQILLRFAQPYENHNGGKICFGKDGLLYIAVGDGGSGGDPGNRAQNKKELLGKILRIDVNKQEAGRLYGIPADNPFAHNGEGFREEIYAYGMRNPWRMNFDYETGLLWAGDVGQNKVEEIDIIEKGGNYGWRVMEANRPYQSGEREADDTFAPPVWSYNQGAETGRSVTGGFVCRDPKLTALQGKYIYGDFVSGNIWALTYSGKQAVKNELIARLRGGLSSFGQDNNKNLYILNYSNGKLYTLNPAL